MHGILTSYPHAGLTDRQRDVLRLIVQGLSNKEIARTLNIAPGIVALPSQLLPGNFSRKPPDKPSRLRSPRDDCSRCHTNSGSDEQMFGKQEQVPQGKPSEEGARDPGSAKYR